MLNIALNAPQYVFVSFVKGPASNNRSYNVSFMNTTDHLEDQVGIVKI